MTGDHSKHPKIDRVELDDDSIAVSRLDAYHCMVGRIASEWASIEFYIDYLIWQLAKVEQQAGACITANMIGAGPRLKAAIALLHLREIPAPLIKKFAAFESHTQMLAISRNRAVHDSWAYGGGDQIVQLRLAITEKKINFGITPIDFNDMVKTYDKIQLANADFRELIAQVFDIFPPSDGIGPYIRPRRPSPTQPLSGPKDGT